MVFTPRDGVWAQIECERMRQNRIWGGHDHDSRHTDDDWLKIINKQIGHLSQQMLDNGRVEREIIQCVAVLVAWAEQNESRAMTKWPTLRQNSAEADNG